MPGSDLSVPEYIGELEKKLRQLLPRALARWDADAIHDARVATRRLTAALDLLMGGSGSADSEPFFKALKRLRRRLGRLRDLDVMLEHLRELALRGRHREAAEWLVKKLEEERKGERRRVRAKLPASRAKAGLAAWADVEPQVREGAAKVKKLLRASLKEQVLDFAKRADAVFGPDDAKGDGQAKDPHALRIAGKRLRYTLELARIAGLPISEALLKGFKRVQDALGLWHDYLVLSEQVVQMAVECHAGYHDRRLYGELLAMSRFTWQESERQLGRFRKLWQRMGRGMTQKIQQAIRPTGSVNGSGEVR